MANLLVDDFNRTNSTTLAGSPSTGGPYTAAVGVWGILSNQLYVAASTANAQLTFPAANDVDFQALYVSGGAVTGTGIIVRRVDASNYWLLSSSSAVTSYQLQRVVAAAGQVKSALYTPPGTPATATLRLVTQGNVISAYVNGVQIAECEDDNYLGVTATAGFRINSNTAVRFDDALAVDSAALSTPGGGVVDLSAASGAVVPNLPAQKWKPPVYAGVGVRAGELAAMSTSAARVANPSEIVPVVQGGQNRRTALLDSLNPRASDRGIAMTAAQSHSGAGSSTNTQMSAHYLEPGIWRIKLVGTENRSASSINGGLYFTHTGGAVSRFIFAKRYVSTAAAAVSDRLLGATSDTSVKLGGGGQRAINVNFNTPDAQDAGDCMVVYYGVVVVTSTIQFVVMGYSNTGGGNNVSMRDGTNITFKKVG